MSAMHVETSGNGIPLLLLHGAGVSGWMWRPTLDRIGPDVTAIVPDLPGFGRSVAQPYVSHRITVGQLAELIRRVAPDGAYLVGFSLGAQLAILLASQHRELVRGVVAVSGETKPAPLPRLTLALLSATAPLARQPWFAKAQAGQLSIPADLMDDYLRDSMATTRKTLIASVGENIRFTLPPEWSTVTCPVAVMVGEKERRLMHESARLTSEAAPESTLHTITGAAHDIPLTRPDALAATIRRRFGIARA